MSIKNFKDKINPLLSDEHKEKLNRAYSDNLLATQSNRRSFALSNNYIIARVEDWYRDRKNHNPAASASLQLKSELISDLYDKNPNFGIGTFSVPFQLQEAPSFHGVYTNTYGNIPANFPGSFIQTGQQAVGNPTPLHVYLNQQASSSSKLFASAVWNLANSGRLVVLPESFAYNRERERGAVAEVVAPSNTDAFADFLEQYNAMLSTNNHVNTPNNTANSTDSSFDKNIHSIPFKK
ncbi:hypothetical protein E3Q10_01661 [Wallemia mellicola]|uniref:Uncharacterized protein n=1 Tax=Wallemia mellicola TaxID=1708541 RepID=A0A4T0S203_9BASI|nr:hypothetical protein E3Q10_01661 [Wallemia mellicola]TIC44676.1 hypothetical protein E3Q08_01792 [Wallemia mellicola]